MQVYNTGDVKSKYTSGLIIGLAGAGKTPLAASAPNPIIITSEPGLKSLQRYKLPYVLGRTHAEAMAALNWVTNTRYETVFFDSISALSENILIANKKKSTDPRRFSPETTAQTMEVVMAYLNTLTNKHLFMTCKAVEEKNQITGATSAIPYAVVPKLGPMLPYHFDNVMFLSRHRDNVGQEYMALRCQQNEYVNTRNRSGLLDLWEPADLSHIIRKSNGG